MREVEVKEEEEWDLNIGDILGVIIGDHHNGVGVLIEKALPEKVSEEKFAEIVSYQREIYTLHHLDRTVPYEGIENLFKRNI